jgi:DNA-binding CsgD family transcriptional regulator
MSRSIAVYVEGKPAATTRDTAEALQLFRQTGDQLQIGMTLGNLGALALAAGDVQAARRHQAEALAIARQQRDRFSIVIGTFNLGVAEYLVGSPDGARALFAESLDLARRAGMRSAIAYALVGLAIAGHGGAGPGWSARLHGAADRAVSELGGESLEPLEAGLAAQDRERLRAEMGDEAFEAEYAAGHALDTAQVVAQIGRTGAVAEPAQAPPAGSGQGVIPLTRLTPRELDVLRLVAQGFSNAGIAERLVISEHTVHRHLANILRKLGVPSRAAATVWAVRSGLV